MEVDQEGDFTQEPFESYGAEHEGHANATHQQQEAPEGGWNHEVRGPPIIDLVPEYDIREDILRLGLRVYEAASEASRRDE
eukprot:5037115-Heterocapsa_arctica.AAC.1